MEIERVAEHLATETDDVLATLPLVARNRSLTDRLFTQLVELLLEAIVLELRTDLMAGELSAADYGNELATLAAQCRRVGLLTKF
jgi:hypothetical protein